MMSEGVREHLMTQEKASNPMAAKPEDQETVKHKQYDE